MKVGATSTSDEMSGEEIQETHRIIKWAEHLANKYQLGINIIINHFVDRRKELSTKEKAMNSIEEELSQLRGH